MRNWSIKIGIKQLIECVFLLIVIGIMWAFGADVWMILSVMMLMFLAFMCLRNINANAFFFFFLISFFIYLMSGDIAELLFDKKYYIQFGREAVVHTHICLFVSLLSIWVGYIFTSSKKNPLRIETIGESNMTPAMVEKVKSASKFIYCIAYIILLINTVDTVRFVAANGYVAYYTSFDPILPSIIIEIGEFAPIALCVFLATFPSKKEASFIIKSYSIILMLMAYPSI